MKPAAFDYVRIDRCEEAVELLARHGEDAVVLAGGQSLVPVLNFRLARPAMLLDISRCADLTTLADDASALEIGAAVTQRAVENIPGLATRHPLLAQALRFISHPQIRSRGTVCGSLAHADPSAELPLLLAALDGVVRLRSAGGEREVAAVEFFTGALSTVRRPDEIVVGARFPVAPPGARQSFVEFAQRHGDFALVAVAAIVNARGIRLGIVGASDRPVARNFPLLAGAALDDALDAFARDLGGIDDRHASAAYRRRLVRSLGRQAVEQAR